MVSRTAEHHISAPLLRTSWETLTFVHWRCPPEQIQALLPDGLTVDVYDGAAWVGLTPFVMANMRPLGVPDLQASKPNRLADFSSTPETNLRTYVHGPDGRDGLWFLSLDIGTAVLAAVLRAAVGAPYHKACLTVEQQTDLVTYKGSRVGGGPSYRLQVLLGGPLEPSDFEVWLTSRWRAYTTRLGRLLVTPVEHEPWPLRKARLAVIEQDLTDSVGLHDVPDPPLVHFTDGVRKVRLGKPTVLRTT